jgi:broad specificity phosphatase PhoE
MLTVILTRHGSTDRSDPEQYLGQRIEAHLTDRGRAAAVSLGERLAGVPFERVISSPLERAFETARLIRPDDEVEGEPRMAEADYGAWEGLTIDRIEAGWPDLRDRWEDDPASVAPPDGESGRAVGRRVRALLRELVAWSGEGDRRVDRRVMLVGHSTVNRVLLAVALGVPLRDYRRRFQQDWANLTVLRFGGPYGSGAQLLLYNDMAHLRGVRGETWD